MVFDLLLLLKIDKDGNIVVAVAAAVAAVVWQE